MELEVALEFLSILGRNATTRCGSGGATRWTLELWAWSLLRLGHAAGVRDRRTRWR